MARKVFFSFDYDDVMAVNVVRNSNVVRGPDKQLPFADHSLYEAAKNTPGAIKNAIDSAIAGTAVTVVLNGVHTWNSKWVRYEIAKSLQKGNGFIVVDIAGVGPRPDAASGPNPLGYMGGVANGLRGPVTIDLFEWVPDKWVPFAMLPNVSNGDAKYPLSLISGSYKLDQRFVRKTTWKSISAFFEQTIEATAREAGWQPMTKWI
jgi:hypothetical protein